MSEDWIGVAEAAQRLGVSRRRVQSYVAEGALVTRVVGGVHLVSGASLEHLRRTRPAGPGAPMSVRGAWRRIAAVAGNDDRPTSRQSLDSFRRAVRTRAEHRSVYIHPSFLSTARKWPSAVEGGRAAAGSFGAAVDTDDNAVEIYLPRSEADKLMRAVRGRIIDDPGQPANLTLHTVPDVEWPFSSNATVAPPWVAWLDLADVDDRAADTVLDQLLGGRVVS